jgi:hypothetical protein
MSLNRNRTKLWVTPFPNYWRGFLASAFDVANPRTTPATTRIAAEALRSKWNTRTHNGNPPATVRIATQVGTAWCLRFIDRPVLTCIRFQQTEDPRKILQTRNRFKLLPASRHQKSAALLLGDSFMIGHLGEVRRNAPPASGTFDPHVSHTIVPPNVLALELPFDRATVIKHCRISVNVDRILVIYRRRVLEVAGSQVR